MVNQWLTHNGFGSSEERLQASKMVYIIGTALRYRILDMGTYLVYSSYYCIYDILDLFYTCKVYDIWQ